MIQVPVVIVQLGAVVFVDVNEFAWTVRRFAEAAKAKEARLLVFPELVGLLLAAPLMAGVKSSLVRSAGRAKGAKAPILRKARGLLAGSVASVLRTDMHGQMTKWLSQAEHIADLEETYRAVFGRIAEEFRLTVVAGSCYTARPPASDLFNTTHVFGPDGALMGTQDQTHLISPVVGELSAGDRLQPIETEAGRLGILVGNDALFPEPARILAYQGAELLINLTASRGNLAAARLQHAFLSRVSENELYGVQAALVGRIPWAARPGAESFAGRSIIAGPMELVPRPNGVMAEMGESVQGMLTGVLDLTGLHRWWADGVSSLRRAMRPGIYQGQLLRYYRAGQTIQAAQTVQQLRQEEPGSAVRAGPWAGARTNDAVVHGTRALSEPEEKPRAAEPPDTTPADDLSPDAAGPRSGIVSSGSESDSPSSDSLPDWTDLKMDLADGEDEDEARMKLWD